MAFTIAIASLQQIEICEKFAVWLESGFGSCLHLFHLFGNLHFIIIIIIIIIITWVYTCRFLFENNCLKSCDLWDFPKELLRWLIFSARSACEWLKSLHHPKCPKKASKLRKIMQKKEIIHIQLHNLPDFIHPSTISQTNEFWKPHPAATYDPPGRHQPDTPGQPETSYNLRGKLGAHWAQYPGARFGFWRGLWVGEEAYIKDTCIYIYAYTFKYILLYIM